MFLNIGRGEDGFEIKPDGLDFDPEFWKVQCINKPLFPVFDGLLKNFGKRWAFHGLGFDDLVVKNLLDLVDGGTGDDESASVSPFFELNFDWLPVIVHFLDDFFNTKLFFSVFGDFFEFVEVFEDFLDFGNFFDGDLHFGVDCAGVFADRFPVAFFHAWVGKDSDERCVANVLFDGVGEPVEHFERTLKDLSFFGFIVPFGGSDGTESVGEFKGFGVHRLDFLFDEFRVKLEDGFLGPDSIVLFIGLNHAPEINKGLNIGGGSLKFRELDLFSHLQCHDIAIDDLLDLFELGEFL